MTMRDPKTVVPGDRGEKQKTAQQQSVTAHDDSCRCEKVSTMTPRQLLGLMLSDLAFWKKPK